MTHPCDRCGKPCRLTSRYCGNKCRSLVTYERHKAANPRPALPRGRPRAPAVKFPPWVVVFEQADPWGDVTRYVFGQETTEAEARRVAAALRRAGRAGVRVERWVGNLRGNGNG